MSRTVSGATHRNSKMSNLNIPGPVISVVSPRLSLSTRTDISSLSTRYSYNADTFDTSNSFTKHSRSYTSDSQPSYSDTFISWTSRTDNSKHDSDNDLFRVKSDLDAHSGSDSKYGDGDTGSYEGSKQTIISRNQSGESLSKLEWTHDDSVTRDSYSDTFETASDNASYPGSRSTYCTGTSTQQRIFDSEHTELSVDYSESFDSTTSRKRTKADESLSGSYEYSYTFEPTDPSTSRITEDHEILQEEAENLDPLSEEQKNNFIKSLLERMRSENLSKVIDGQTEDTFETGIKEDRNLSQYCQRKIKMLTSKCVKVKAVSKEMPKVPITAYGLNPAVMERLKLQNIMRTMEDAAKTKIHEPSKCKSCLRQAKMVRESEAQNVFVQSRCRKLQSQIMEEKISNHLLRMNTVSMIGEIIQSLPKSSEDPLEAMYDKAKAVQKQRHI